jgi:hypothetical protein
MKGTYLALISGLTLDMRKGIILGTICKQNKICVKSQKKNKKVSSCLKFFSENKVKEKILYQDGFVLLYVQLTFI